ncbi:hypothetical protein CTI14_71105, partial [Methylobacterium radiotolerans]
LEASLHGYVQSGAFALDTASVANQGLETARNWNAMSSGELEASLHGYVQSGAFALDTASVANQGLETARNWN